jgi:ribose 5-phosphate isomerase B
MTIYLGADHRGFALKERIKAALAAQQDGDTVIDLGAPALDPADDYPDYAVAVAEKISADPAGSHGIVICGSGFGVDIIANRFAGVRSALAMSPEHISAGRHDDDVNVLALAANFIGPDAAMDIVRVFLATPFEKEERYERRLAKIDKIEGKK